MTAPDPAAQLLGYADEMTAAASAQRAGADALTRLPGALAQLDAAQVQVAALTVTVAARDATVADLTQRLADCKAATSSPPTSDPPPNPTPPAVSITLGANGSNPPDYSYGRFQTVEKAFGARLAPARLFSGQSAKLSGPAAECLAAGRSCAYSIAVDVEAGIRGDHDQAVRDGAVALAAVPGSKFLSIHEPEQPPKNIPGPRFVAWQQRFYSLIREVAPELSTGPAHQSYQYEGVWANRGLDGSYLTGDGDFIGLDYYTGVPKSGNPGVPLQQQPGWINWYKLVRPIALERGLPIQFLEYGVYHSDQAAREDILRRDRDYLQRLNADPAEPDVDMLCLWLGSGAAGDWQTGMLQSAPLLRELYAPPPLT